MAPTIGPDRNAGKYRRRDSALSTYVAQGGSRTLAGAHAKELRTFAAARQFISCYAVPRALRALEGLRACIAEVVRPVTKDRLEAADAADRAEDAAQTRYLLNPNATTQETYVRSLFASAAAELELARDLDADRRALFPPDAMDREVERRGQLALEEGL